MPPLGPAWLACCVPGAPPVPLGRQTGSGELLLTATPKGSSELNKVTAWRRGSKVHRGQMDTKLLEGVASDLPRLGGEDTAALRA